MFDNLRNMFETGLIVLFLLSTIAYIIYRLSFAKSLKQSVRIASQQSVDLPRKARRMAKHHAIDAQLSTLSRKFVYFFADLFWVLLFVVVVRSFIAEPFIIPSKSMKPGLVVSDIILVNKSSYGIRLPIIDTKITEGEGVKRGDVAVFKYPKNPEISYIKRIIGLPGDKIYYDNRRLRINGKLIPLTKLREESDSELLADRREIKQQYDVYEADLLGVKHEMRYDKQYVANFPVTNLTVPEGKYFVMGDNRDNSGDGRAFGFVPDENLIGRATRIVLNMGCLKGSGRCDRFLKKIQ